MDGMGLEHVSKSYGTGALARPVFRDLTLALPAGEITVVVGRSGCGKTTLLRLLGGLETPDSGAIRLPAGLRSAMLYPEPYLITWTSALHNVSLSAGAGMEPEARDALARELLELVQLGECAELTPAELSSGMKQRLALARALAGRAELLLMDEPFASLDFLTRGELQQSLLDVQARQPRTIVFVTHQLDEALIMADRVAAFGPDGSVRVVPMEDLPRPRDPASPEASERRRQIMAACTG